MPRNVKNTKSKKNKNAESDLVYGVLDVTRSGMGYVIVEGRENDIMIRSNDFNTAMNGDKVSVRIIGDPQKAGRVQGVVEEVLERKQSQFLGKIDVSQNFAFFIADSGKSMPDIYIPLNKLNGAKDKDRVSVKVTQWEKNKKPQGEVLQVMNASDENDLAMKELIMEAGFPIGFSDEVLEESERLPDTLSSKEIKKRKDFRDILTFTIDPVDARDFDDAISYRVLKNGNYEIGVHIADVSYYVVPGSELDKAAFERATSVYLPDRVNPMLPERISNGLCSLRPKEDKFTFSAVFEINTKGDIKKTWIGKTAIHSDHRFSYEEVQEIIEKKEGFCAEEILLLNKFAQRFRKQRFKKGAINFSSVEVRFKLDENGKPIGVVLKESKEAHQLIEEFMLLANRAVAEAAAKVKVHKKLVPFPYRIHDTPDEDKLKPFVEFAKKYGHKFDTSSPENISASFNQLLEDARGKPEQHVLEQLGIRTMAKAVYSSENIGHYGLGFEHYTHFTSPIRRYPDVLVHRVMEQILNEEIEPDKKMEEKCKHCSDRERAAMETERAANKYKQVEFMKDKLGEEFDGVISGVSSFGFWVETVEHKCEGLVSINSLFEFDDFRHMESDYCLSGKRSGRTFRMGDKIKIKVVAANLTKRQLDYQWILPANSIEEKSSKLRIGKSTVKTKGKKNSK
ncbi:MAG: ribonuclease R [Chitinophagaceae bacterium]|nr:ribonuclease R [Chitinophagaceae bacterium]